MRHLLQRINIPRQPVSLAAISIFLLLIMTGLAGCGTLENAIYGPTITPAPPGGTPIAPAVDLPDFTLTNQDGEAFSLSDLSGKPALFYFGYTFCPDVCPLTLAEMGQAAAGLGDQAAEAAFVFVSVDIQRDTPERLKTHLSLFNTDFIGLTTDDESILQDVTEAFDIYYELEDVAETQAEYLVAHTASTFLVNGEGQLVMEFPYRTNPAVITEEIQALLAGES
jgi:protein SCO1/2